MHKYVTAYQQNIKVTARKLSQTSKGFLQKQAGARIVIFSAIKDLKIMSRWSFKYV